MRDEIESRIWLAHHEAYSEIVGKACAALGARLRRLLGARRRRAETPE